MEEPPRLHLGSRTQTVSMVRDICYSEAMGGKAMLSGILLSRVSPVLFCFFFPQARTICPTISSLELVPICSLNRHTPFLQIRRRSNACALCEPRHCVF